MAIDDTASAASARAPTKPTPRRPRISADTVSGYAFLAPFLIVYAVFLIYPLWRGFFLSLHQWDLLAGPLGWTGLQNYSDMLSDPAFWNALTNTFYFVVLTVPITTALALALALALSRPTRTNAVFRAIFFSSSIVSVTVVTLIWQMVLSPSQGILAQALGTIGIPPLDWLNDQHLAMFALVIATVWWSLGLPLMLFTAGIQQIPGDIYEAAKLDNASRWKTFRYITWPALHRTTVLVVLIEIILHFQVFGQPFLMTKGGPAGATRSLVQYIYESGFRDWHLGYASTGAMVLFVVMLVASLAQLYFSRKED
ncbi:carbohydrate ABC transporter permease [Salinisphaera sp. RV14]|uniref:carbohydrate ABC transporter permease n=1 Tax=unclassified Salinisphaera TaxID=2649847 RepID=UPI003F8731C3